MAGRGYICLALQGELLPIAERSSSVAQSGNLVIIVGGRRDVVGGGEPVGFGEGVQLFGAGAIELRPGGLDECAHLVQ